MHVMEQEPVTEKYGVQDLDISLIAVKAAAEAEQLAQNQNPDLENIKLVANFLSSGLSLVDLNEDSGVRSLANPTTIDVLKNAYNASHGVPLASLQDLVEKTKQLSEQLNELPDGSTGDLNFLESLRDFCVALAKYSMNARSEFLGQFDVDPTRK